MDDDELLVELEQLEASAQVGEIRYNRCSIRGNRCSVRAYGIVVQFGVIILLPGALLTRQEAATMHRLRSFKTPGTPAVCASTAFRWTSRFCCSLDFGIAIKWLPGCSGRRTCGGPLSGGGSPAVCCVAMMMS
eukprot:GHVS01082204.1.p1 GENE.GHVS01082204.1~~GHVS01082204.1.p1  ORF type:complete len:133 (-),score=19.25 GHVS01082204.1:133-531(-)